MRSSLRHSSFAAITICSLIAVPDAAADTDADAASEGDKPLWEVSLAGFSRYGPAYPASDDYQTDGSCNTLMVPENGVLLVAPDVFEAFRPCGATKSTCNVITAAFADGQEIILYSPLASSSDFASDTQMLLGLFAQKDAIWYAVGTHEQLRSFLEQVRREKYQKIERFLPPNDPFRYRNSPDSLPVS